MMLRSNLLYTGLTRAKKLAIVVSPKKAITLALRSKEAQQRYTQLQQKLVQYNGELIVQPRQRWSREQQLELLDTYPMFTGRCPQCGNEFDRDYMARVHVRLPMWVDG